MYHTYVCMYVVSLVRAHTIVCAHSICHRALTVPNIVLMAEVHLLGKCKAAIDLEKNRIEKKRKNMRCPGWTCICKAATIKKNKKIKKQALSRVEVHFVGKVQGGEEFHSTHVSGLYMYNIYIMCVCVCVCVYNMCVECIYTYIMHICIYTYIHVCINTYTMYV